VSDEQDYMGSDEPQSLKPVAWIYDVALWLDTDLEALKHHGKRVEGDAIRIEYGRGGRWLPQYDGIRSGYGDGYTTSSIGGTVSADGGDVLPFLIAYRTIIEDEKRTVRGRVEAVRELIDDPAYLRFSRVLDHDIPTRWVASRFCRKLNIGGGPAKALVDLGILDVEDLLELTEQDLKSMPGVGPKTQTAIRILRRRLTGPPE
jgi:hypothetical protein